MLLVAHRTPASRVRCARLADAGARVFEIDVQLAHGRVAVSHFLPWGRGGYLQRDNWRVRWHTASARDPGVGDIAALVPDGASVLLDIKEKLPERRRDLLTAIAETLPDRTRYLVCGPQPDDLERARAAGFGTWRTVRNRRDLAAVLADGRLADAAVSIRHALLDSSVLDRLHAVTPTVVAWTVNDPARARWLRDVGADGVTTDRTSVMRAAAHPPRVK